MITLRHAALILLVFAASASLLYAGPKKKGWEQAKWKVPKYQYNIVTATNVTAGTVSIKHVGGKDQQEHEDLKTNGFTEIIVDGKRATLSSLAVGTHVSYTLSGDGLSAARIETVAEPAPPPTPVPTATPSFPSNKKK